MLIVAAYYFDILKFVRFEPNPRSSLSFRCSFSEKLQILVLSSDDDVCSCNAIEQTEGSSVFEAFLEE